ncbi:MAG: hypothetical protein ACHQ4H_02645 [Ktedonobacterales bacterium]
MNDPKHRTELAERVEQRRRELNARPDISQAMRRLSSSSPRNTLDALPKKRLTKLTMIFGVAGVVAVLAVILTVATFAFFQNQLNDPTSTVDNFYGALHGQQYTQAYGYLAQSAQKHLAETAFTDTYAGLDQTGGIVDSYTKKSSVTNGGVATIVMVVVRRGNTRQAQVQTLTLVQEDSKWRISGITAGATVPAPTLNP